MKESLFGVMSGLKAESDEEGEYYKSGIFAACLLILQDGGVRIWGK